ncbi:hypothetical protein [Chryseolinea lacunae]|uniref:DUF695 domain-containing protein n=1 Tax=Chryseolinea lacunae TaxID=2801331 RepID=A0ABS1KMK0_9BACT|nr:hypothetical protein [Chryseolinea lacunae]MBL0740695.1 hypothetical protein [Chryseolinea lacunae]
MKELSVTYPLVMKHLTTMGLGIHLRAKIAAPIQLSTIQDHLTRHSSGLFKDFLSFSGNENSLHVTVHPCEETVAFELVDNNLICSARTNSVGPGYHAYLVELVEKLGTVLGIEWNWNFQDDEEHYSDETDYYNHRNFKQLQFEMLKWLRALANSLIVESNSEQFMLTMPLGYPRMKRSFFAASPMRIWTRELFKKIAESEIEDLEWAAQEFFIWWNRKDDEQFYKKTGIALLNVECPWHYPTDDLEKKVLYIIDNTFERSKQLNPQLDLPLKDWDTVKKFLNEEETDIPDTEFGYKKHLMTFDLPGKWMIDLPGNIYHTVDDSSEVYYDHERTVRCICYTRNDDKSDAEYADGFFSNKNDYEVEYLASATNIAGNAVLYYSIDKETQQEYWILQGVKVKGGKFAFSTISYPSEEHKKWAIDAWNSIR